MLEPCSIDSSGRNNYLFSPNDNTILLVHPILSEIFKLYEKNGLSYIDKWYRSLSPSGFKLINGNNFSKKTILYYVKFFNILLNNGFFNEKQTKNNVSGRYTHEDIRYNLTNTKQITFELTEKCNLKCTYCAYLELYADYDPRDGKELDIDYAKNLIEYIFDLKKRNNLLNKQEKIILTFYGGEPLLKIDLIKKIIEYIENNIGSKYFSYGMTTNATLLNKYVDYLDEKKFKLLISLDGNFEQNQHRIFHNNRPAFNKIIQNIYSLRNKYPDFYDRIRFNAVLNNNSTVLEVYDFFKHLGKIPKISEISQSGVNKIHQDELLSIYKSKNDDLNKNKDLNYKNSLSFEFPKTKLLAHVLQKFTNNNYDHYFDIFQNKNNKEYVPTGTCIPFSKRVFITASGKIFPCEKIGHHYSLGKVNKTGVELNFDSVAEKYNRYFDKQSLQCKSCYNNYGCLQCMYISDIENNESGCSNYTDKKAFGDYIAKNIDFLEDNPYLYKPIIEEFVQL